MATKSRAYELAEMIYARLEKLPADEKAKRMKLIRELKIRPNKNTPNKRATRRSPSSRRRTQAASRS